MGRHVCQSRKLKIRFGKQFAVVAFGNSYQITSLALIIGDLGDPTIYGDLAMAHQLAGAGHAWSKSNAEINIVEMILEQFEQVDSSSYGTGGLNLLSAANPLLP